MLSEFLRESSIHGLRYLVEARLGIVRLLWLVSISSCFTFAVVIIYLNVHNWQNSPAVVTSIQPESIEGAQRLMVTVCPQYESTNNFMFNLLTEQSEFIDDGDVKEILMNIERARLVNIMRSRNPKSQAEANAADVILDQCREMKDYRPENRSEACKLAFLLVDIAYTSGKSDMTMTAVREYVLQANLNGEELTLENLRHSASKHMGKAVESQNFIPGEYSYVKAWKVLTGYSYFFPVFEDAGESRRQVISLKSLEDYEPPPMLTIDRRQDLASILGYTTDRLATQENELLNNATATLVFNTLSSFLGLDKGDETFHVMNAFAYDPVTRPFFSTFYMDHTFKPPCGEAAETENAAKVCRKPSGEACQAYCDLVAKGRAVEDKILAAFKMSEGNIGKLQKGNPQSLLPMCQVDESQVSAEECFSRVITDKGVCFSSFKGLNEKPISGMGKAYGFKFALDRGGQYYFDHGLRQKTVVKKYDILVSPAGHFSLGRLTEEKKVTLTYEEAYTKSFVYNAEITIDYIARTTAGFHQMSQSTRGCAYSHEVSLDLLPVYNEANCVLECAWKSAKDTCGCVPWFLREYFPRLPICEFYGNSCFKAIVSGRHSPNSSCSTSCLRDCDSIDYSVQFTRDFLKYNFEDLSAGKEIDAKAGDFFEDYVYKAKLNNTSEGVLSIVDILRDYPIPDNVGVIQVYPAKKTTLRIVRTATVTFIDMLSNIGGTLGLFCGFSILSGIELIYWMAKVVTRGKI